MQILKRVSDYFDLNNNVSRRTTRSIDLKNSNYVVPQYVALAIGITVQPFLEHYQAHNNWGDLNLFLGRTIFGLLIGLAIFPAVYKKSWDNDNPIFIQFCSIFSAGLGWQTLIAAGSHIVNQ